MPKGEKWIPAETDVSIRPGWFWHAKENDKVRTPQNLVNLYYQSAGRNSLLLLNIPPNNEGLFEQSDIDAITQFRSILNETFAHNLAKGVVTAALTDNQLSTFVPLALNKPFVINFGKKISFDRAMVQENIATGQKIETALLEYWDGKAWKTISDFTTVGYKRLLRFDAVNTTKARITITAAKGPVQLAALGFYKASSRE